jgi:hypothetical protein
MWRLLGWRWSDHPERYSGRQGWIQRALTRKRPATLQVGDGLEERLIVGVVVEDLGTVVASIDDVVDEAVVDRSQRVWRAGLNL